MLYLIVKALHVVAIVAWTGGMLLMALLLASLQLTHGPFVFPQALLVTLRRWDRRITTPAMVLVWVLGLALSLRGHWFGAAWLTAKLLLVLALSALHGIQVGTLRRYLIADGTRIAPSAMLRFAPVGILLCITAIVVLVILKPYWALLQQ